MQSRRPGLAAASIIPTRRESVPTTIGFERISTMLFPVNSRPLIRRWPRRFSSSATERHVALGLVA